MSDNSLNNRIIVPDLMKGVAILFMIQVHLIELFATPAIFESWIGKLSLFLGGVPAAPVFMMIMGFFLARKQLASKTLALRGLKLLWWGILLNIGLNFHLIYKVLFESWPYNIWQYIFGVDILPLAGLSLLFIAAIPKFIKEKWYFLALLILLIFGVSFFTKQIEVNSPWNYISSFLIGGTEWSYFPLFPWLAYPLTGILFFQIQKSFKPLMDIKYIPIYSLIALIIFLVLSWNYSSEITYNLKSYYSHGIGFYLWAIIFSLLYSGIFLFFRNFSASKLSQYLIFTGKSITSIYVIQWLFIGNLATIWYKQIDGLFLVLSFLLITILSSSLSWLWNKLKLKF